MPTDSQVPDNTRTMDYCIQCNRPMSRCICSFVTHIDNPLPVVILQHLRERHHPKGTAKLAQMCLANCDIISEKDFSLPLKKILDRYQPILLWPATELYQQITKLPAEVFQTSRPTNTTDEKPYALIVIDGTWKKANKIFLSHPEFQTMPRCMIENQSNQYHHRKSPSDQHLSTLEAIYFGLKQLQPNGFNDKLKELLNAQQAMVEHWQREVRKHQQD